MKQLLYLLLFIPFAVNSQWTDLYHDGWIHTTGTGILNNYNIQDFANDTMNQVLPTGWTAGTGAYTVDTLTANDAVLTDLTVGEKVLTCGTAGTIGFESLQAYDTWEFYWYKDGQGNDLRTNFINSDQTAEGGITADGYFIEITNAERINLYELADGAQSVLFATATVYISVQIWYKIKVVRSASGVFTTYIKGGAFGSTYTLIDVTGGAGTNPVTDNTYTGSNYFVLDLDDGDKITKIERYSGIIKTPEISDCILHLSTADKQFADGDTIQTWEDNTIYGNDASQATETNRPTYDLTNDTGSMVFDGVDNYMDMGSILNIGKVHTISFWVNNTDFTTLNTITANGVNHTIRMSSTYLYYIINGSTYSFLNPFSTNKWYHVVIVRNGTALSTYFNGIAGATATITSVNNIDMTYRYIGMRTNNLYLAGKLDDIQIFSKALSTTEIASLYANKVQAVKLIKLAYNDSATALFDRITGDEPIEFKNAASEFYDTIQAYHIDDTLDFLYNFAAHNENGAVQDWLHPTRTATLVNSPVFTAYEGFTGDASSSYVKTNYNPGTDAVNYLLNSASLGVYIRTNIYVATKSLIGINDGTNSSFILMDATTIQNRINTNSGNSYSHGNNITGFTILTRAASNSISYARNSANYSVGTNNSNGIPNQALGFFIGAYNSNGSPIWHSGNQFSFAFGGGQLTELQKTKLYEAMERYLDRFGKGVN